MLCWQIRFKLFAYCFLLQCQQKGMRYKWNKIEFHFFLFLKIFSLLLWRTNSNLSEFFRGVLPRLIKRTLIPFVASSSYHGSRFPSKKDQGLLYQSSCWFWSNGLRFIFQYLIINKSSNHLPQPVSHPTQWESYLYKGFFASIMCFISSILWIH